VTKGICWSVFFLDCRHTHDYKSNQLIITGDSVDCTMIQTFTLLTKRSLDGF